VGAVDTDENTNKENTMKTCIATLESISTYSQSKAINEEDFPKKNKESHDEYEKRSWRERCHAAKDGQLYIPAIAFKAAVQAGACYIGDKIKGKGMKGWAEKFRAGILVDNDMVLPEKKDTVPSERLHCSPNGKRGGNTRVYRYFPVIASWKGDVTFHILDDEITEEQFIKTLKQAGMFVGIGRWRPANGGQNGRFSVVSHKWIESEE
jgi:hypothetical protein